MSSRNRTASSADWDNLRAECDNSIHLMDEEVVEYDHCRLYITNLPTYLTEDGLGQAFSKYGTLVEVFINADPRKRFALVRYDSPGSANLALTKLHQADPLRLNIAVAKKGKTSAPGNSRYVTVAGSSTGDHKRYKHDTDGTRGHGERKNRQSDEDNISVTSRLKDRSDSIHEDIMIKEMDGDSPDEVQKLELQVVQLKLQETQLKLKQALKKTKGKELQGSRNVFRDSDREIRGAKIVVRNDRERGTTPEKHELDKTFGTGAGDSPPPLLRQASQNCVSCDKRSGTLYCGRCEVTPYCSVLCQKRDWIRRHRSVCHNLARLSLDADDEDDEHDGVMPSLRRPHKLPTESNIEELTNNNNENIVKSSDGSQRNNDGFQRKNDGFQRNNDGCQRNNDGSQRKNDGFQRKNDGFKRSNDGSQRNNDGFQRKNDGFQRNNDGFQRSNDGSQRNTQRNNDGFQRNNDGSQRNNDGSQRNNDGFQRKNDGFQRNNDGYQRKNDGVDRNERFDRRGDGQSFNQRSNQRSGGKPQEYNRRPAVKAEDDEDWPAPTQETSNPVKSPATATPPQPDRNANVTATATPTQPARNVTATAETITNVVAQKDVKATKPPLVPEKCLIDKLSVGDTVMVSVLEGDVKGQVVCLSLSPAYADDYQKLCEDYVAYCAEKAKKYVPNPGETFSLLDSTDGYWYRARCLDADKAALIDAGRVLDYKGLETKDIGAEYKDIIEYCCVLDADGQCNPGDCYTCVVKSRDVSGRVAVSRVCQDTAVSDAILTRWTPPVTYKIVSETITTPSVPVVIPSVPRPSVSNKSVMTLVHVESRDRLVLRQASEVHLQRDDMLEAEVAHYGLTAKPLTTPPTKGDVVIAKYTDDICYRALVKRTSVKQNKYLLEYIEFGQEDISPLERLYPCPADMHLSTRGCYAAVVSLADVEYTLTEPALEYLNQLKDKDTILVVKTPADKPSVPSGSPVTLLVQSSGVNVNRRVEEMCKPDWKKVEEKGGDVFDTKLCMLDCLSYLPLPTSGNVQILDSNALGSGVVAVCPPDCSEYMTRLLGPVTDRMSEYCNSKIGSEPYMPRLNELCIAKFPPQDGWYRAVLVEQTGGAGSDTAVVLYLDYGNVGPVTSHDIRKMMYEYVDQLPALASSVEIQDFPADMTPSMLSKAKAFLQIPPDDTVGGVLPTTSVVEIEPGAYRVTAPALLAAIRG